MLNLFEQNVDLNIIAGRNNLKRAVPNERLYMQKGAGARSYAREKSMLPLAMLLPFRTWQRSMRQIT